MSTSSQGSKPSSGWQPPSLEEMQAMLPQYRFEKLLGRGGMGAVYKAVQASLDRPVAIKVLPGDLIDDDDAQFAERFKNEARTMAKLSHPGIVDVFDFGETRTGLLYIVMEFIEGTDIAQMIQSQGKLPEDYALSITAHVCDALAYAHQNGIVHRDIKPANILINMEGAIKVADFGLAKANDPSQSGLTKTNMAMGTPDFVAPEAFIPGVPLDGRADLYAIGVMLYQMLTGEIPRGIWTLPGMKVGTDPRFDAIITKAMQTDREVRYQTATDIRRDLDTILTLPRSALIAQQQAAAEAAAQASREARQQEAAAAQAPRKGPPVQARAPQPVVKKSSSNGLIFGLAAIVVAAAGAFFIFGGGDTTKPGDTAATSGAPRADGDTTKQAAPPATGKTSTTFSNFVPTAVWRDAMSGEWPPGWTLVGTERHLTGPGLSMRQFPQIGPNAGIRARFRSQKKGQFFDLIQRLKPQERGRRYVVTMWTDDKLRGHLHMLAAGDKRRTLSNFSSQPLVGTNVEHSVELYAVGNRLTFFFDGQMLASAEDASFPDGHPAILAGPGIEIISLETAEFSGSAPAAAPVMTSPVATAPVVPLDVTQHFSGLSLPRDLLQKGSRSSWEFSGDHLVLSDTTFQDLQLLALPLKPGDSYELDLEYAFHADNRGYLKLFLPAPQGWCSLQLHTSEIVCFFDNNRQPHNHAVKPGGETNRLRVKSERSGAAAHFTVTLDGKPVTEFTGTGVTEWQHWPDMSPLRGSICLGGETKSGPPITLHSMRLVSNEGAPSTMAAVAKPAVTTTESPAPAPLTGWIDLLAAADVQRDSLQLPWSLTDGVLQSPAEPNSATTPDGHNTFAFPVPDPPLNYDLRYRLSRNKPGAAIVMPFRRGNETPALYVDAGYGFQLFGAKKDGLKNSGPAWFPPDKVIHEVLIEVRESHLNVRYDGRLLIETGEALPKGQVGQPFFQSAKHKDPIIGIGVCGGLITVHEAAYRPVDVLAEKAALMSATDPYLAKLESGFQARYQTEAQKPFEAALASLNQSYITNGISKARAAAQAKGALPEVLAFDREKALVEKDSDVSAEDAADTPDSLKKLRATYRTARARLIAERDAKAAPLMKIYLKALDDYAAELTKAGKLDEAKQVQALRDMKSSKEAAATPAVAQAVVPSTPAPSTPAPSADAPVAAATFLANNGGSCVAVKDGVRIEVKTAADVPALPFEVVEIYYDTYQGASKTAKSSDFQALNGLRSLRRVIIRAPECKLLTDDAYVFLAGNEELGFINLEGVPAVTDGVLKHLSSAKKLTTLGVQYAPGFTGEGLASMPFLPGLVNADFLRSGLNDKGVEALTACAQLQKLRITQGSATDTAFAKLGSLPKLVDLRVDHTGFGDEAAAAIASAGILRYLDASFTEIGNNGLGKLEALTSLTELVISQTKVSDAAVVRLQKALPNCKVTR